MDNLPDFLAIEVENNQMVYQIKWNDLERLYPVITLQRYEATRKRLSWMFGANPNYDGRSIQFQSNSTIKHYDNSRPLSLSEIDEISDKLLAYHKKNGKEDVLQELKPLYYKEEIR